ncbi:fumarylacetoacetate hydrolase family protein [Streptomyces sp. NBC_00687]|uniref:fumarylacetoacetate hydrolase family protein n=1 Tax=Streptomyces sp. NBC_00687 TaxID=2975807 RepID=UPI00225AEC98|nr:fumarylacetoacetate hydrolase family protein [Streptomyces sp. NBC_00687]MCX4919057.1 fumarylacetoacetate hydrolase family protein [Streptomyces sp. NBC_00687]
MRFATLRIGNTLTAARIEGDRAILVNAGDAVDAYLRRDRLMDIGEMDARTAHYARVSPVPAHILCIGLNYRSHIEELERTTPTYPTFFAKFPSTLTGSRDEIALPRISDHIDGEAELAVIVGQRLRRASVDDAHDAIAGYSVANDLSLRDWQHRTTEALQGKVFDRSTPLGPVLVTPEEIDNARDLTVTFTVDGVEWQHGSTSDLLFTPAELLAYCSTFLTLEPGDVILTGTPGKTERAAETLTPGQQLVTAIEGIGAAINPTGTDPLPDTRAVWRERTSP